MLELAQNYVNSHKITFSTHPEPKKSKTKGIIFSKKPLHYDPKQLSLNGDVLPWICSAKYLGSTIRNNMDRFNSDCTEKRARYIEKNCELNQEFKHAHPEVKCTINRIYNSSFPGSVLWDFSSDNFKQIVNSWSTSVRIMWDVPYMTHRYMVEPLGGEHALTMIISRYIKFIKTLKKSPKIAVQYLIEKVSRNCNTLTGKNIHFILEKLNIEDIHLAKPSQIREIFRLQPIARENLWRINFAKEIVNLKQNILFLDQDTEAFTQEELQDILNYICTS